MYMFGDIWRIGSRNVMRNLRRSIITGGMIALGVVASVFFRAYVMGLQDLMVAQVVDESSGAMQVERRGYAEAREVAPLDQDLPVGSELESLIRSIPGVREVAPRLRFNALLLSGEVSSIVAALAVDPQRERRVCPQGPAGNVLRTGHYGLDGPGLSGPDENAVVLGSTLAAGLRLRIGDTVTLLAQTRGGSTDAVDAVVRGLFRTGDAEINKRLLVLPIGLAQRLVHMAGRATSFAVSAERSAIPSTATSMRSALAGVIPAVEVRTWDQLAPYYRDVIRLQDDIMRIVAGLFFVLVLAGVGNTMMMSAFEREREVGTLMALGFRRRSILLLFVTEATTLGMVAGAVGAGLGTVVVAVFGRIGLPFTIPAVGTIVNYPRIDTSYLMLSATVALAAAFLAGTYPAWRASRLQPVDALRDK